MLKHFVLRMGLHNELQTHAYRKRTSEVKSRRTKEKAFWKGGERSLKSAILLVGEDHEQGHWRSESATAAVVSWTRAANTRLHSCSNSFSSLQTNHLWARTTTGGSDTKGWISFSMEKENQIKSVLKGVKKPQLAIWLSKAWAKNSWATGFVLEMRYLWLLSAAATHDLFMPKVTLKRWEAWRTQGGELVFFSLPLVPALPVPTAKSQELTQPWGSMGAEASQTRSLAAAFVISHMLHTPFLNKI